MLINCSNGIAPLKTLGKVPENKSLFFCFIGVQVQIVVVIGSQTDQGYFILVIDPCFHLKLVVVVFRQKGKFKQLKKELKV